MIIVYRKRYLASVLFVGLSRDEHLNQVIPTESIGSFEALAEETQQSGLIASLHCQLASTRQLIHGRGLIYAELLDCGGPGSSWRLECNHDDDDAGWWRRQV